jgi:hypothetical protein
MLLVFFSIDCSNRRTVISWNALIICLRIYWNDHYYHIVTAIILLNIGASSAAQMGQCVSDTLFDSEHNGHLHCVHENKQYTSINFDILSR